MPDARTSGLETTVFSVLDFVLGCGEQDVRVPFYGRMNLDMLFKAETGFRLGVEYDGAYWHRHTERRDARKSHLLTTSGFVHLLMRIREYPLRPLGELDVVVPPGSRGPEVAVHALLHLSHTVANDFGYETRERIDFSLGRPGRSIKIGRLLCTGCLRQATRYPVLS